MKNKALIMFEIDGRKVVGELMGGESMDVVRERSLEEDAREFLENIEDVKIHINELYIEEDESELQFKVDIIIYHNERGVEMNRHVEEYYSFNKKEHINFDSLSCFGSIVRSEIRNFVNDSKFVDFKDNKRYEMNGVGLFRDSEDGRLFHIKNIILPPSGIGKDIVVADDNGGLEWRGLEDGEILHFKTEKIKRIDV